MKQIKTADLAPGEMFTEPVYIEGDTLLVPPKIPLRQKDLDRLARWKIETVETEGEPVSADQLEEEFRLQQRRSLDDPVANPLLDSYQRQIERLDGLFTDVLAGENIDHSDIDVVAAELLRMVLNARNDSVQLMLAGPLDERTLATQAVNSTIIAVLIGSAVKLNSHRLFQLAVSAVLHDLGMGKIPATITQKQGRLSQEELTQIRTHPIHGYRIVSRDLKYSEEIAAIALQHHERWDGNGYPRRLKGQDIALGARVLALADAYQAMVCERPYRNSMIGYAAMKEVLSDNGRHFDPGVLKGFLGIMGIFPVGSVVQLNDSRLARVVGAHSEAPLRPLVETITDEMERKVSHPQEIVLHDKKQLFVAKAIDPREYSSGDGGTLRK